MWHLESIAEQGRAMRTFVCIIPETGCRVTTDNGESLQRRERLCAGRSIRLFKHMRAKQAYLKGDMGLHTISVADLGFEKGWFLYGGPKPTWPRSGIS